MVAQALRGGQEIELQRVSVSLPGHPQGSDRVEINLTGNEELDNIIQIAYVEAEAIHFIRDHRPHYVDTMEKCFRDCAPIFFFTGEWDSKWNWIRQFIHPFWLGIGTEMNFCGPNYFCEICMKGLSKALCRLLWERLELGPYPKDKIKERGME